MIKYSLLIVCLSLFLQPVLAQQNDCSLLRNQHLAELKEVRHVNQNAAAPLAPLLVLKANRDFQKIRTTDELLDIFRQVAAAAGDQLTARKSNAEMMASVVDDLIHNLETINFTDIGFEQSAETEISRELFPQENKKVGELKRHAETRFYQLRTGTKNKIDFVVRQDSLFTTHNKECCCHDRTRWIEHTYSLSKKLKNG